MSRDSASGSRAGPLQASRLLALQGLSTPDRRAVRLLLALLLLWALGLRVWLAAPRLDSTRFYDERFPLENVQALLSGEGLRPANGLHPALTHLPHAGILALSRLLHRATGREAFAVQDGRGHFTPTAYLLCRLLQALLGTASLALVFLIGRRLAGPRLGVLAAFLLSIVPWHLRQSVVFKADIVLIFTLVFAFWLALRALERPTAAAFALAGAGIGLALSSKFNGGPIAIPLAVGTWLTLRPARRGFALLALAALVSLAVFLAINPYVALEPGLYQRDMGGTLRSYARDGEAAGVTSGAELLSRAAASLLTPAYHGPVIGLVALVSLAFLLSLSAAWGRRSASAPGWLVLGAYVAAYLGFYAAVTSNPAPHAWLPVTPFLALAAAWGLLALWSLVSSALPPTARPITAWSAALLVVLPLAGSAQGYVYRRTVPRTGDLALAHLRHALHPPSGRLVLTEHDFDLSFNDQTFAGRLAIDLRPSLAALPARALERADVEIFPASRLGDPAAPGAAFYHRRVKSTPAAQVLEFTPRLFHAYGPSLVVLLHPWRPVGQVHWGELTRTPQGRGRYVASLPRDPRCAACTYSLRVKGPGMPWLLPAELATRDDKAPLVAYRGPGGRREYLSHRFGATRRVRLETSREIGPDTLVWGLQAWSRGPR